MYSRPILCRLCEFPVADDGVRVAELDLQKLARWWLQELDDDAETIERSWICQFCLCDARFKCVAESQQSECNWWMPINKIYKTFYLEGAFIQQCGVRMSRAQVPTPEILPRVRKGAVTISLKNYIPTVCLYCEACFNTRAACVRHVFTTHRNVKTFRCKVCQLFFKSQEEKNVHSKTGCFKKRKCHICHAGFQSIRVMRSHIFSKHSKNGIVTCCNVLLKSVNDLYKHMWPRRFEQKECIYCRKLLKASTINVHMKRKHKSVAIRCIYTNCRTYFLNDKEKQQHNLQYHESIDGLKQCPYCPLKLTVQHIRRHVMEMHHTVAIKCKYEWCLAYFNTEEERLQHVSLVHNAFDQDRQSFNCIYCNKMYTQKRNLYSHIKQVHTLVRCVVEK